MVEVVQIGKRALEANEERAKKLRERFASSGTLVVNIISSPGSGKTTLLEETAKRLGNKLSLAALVGDVATELDAERLRRAGMSAHQILTAGACHLDARLIEIALSDFPADGVDILFIENVGNLICPTNYDLGEDFKVAMLSVTEGDDKPFKYPAIFSKAKVTLLGKVDLLGTVRFNPETATRQVKILNPQAVVIQVSPITGRGMDEWCSYLEGQLEAKRREIGR